jgi:tetratricopeptide (TPR) repeat protein
MRPHEANHQEANSHRVSLEKKIRLLLRKFRASERHSGRSEPKSPGRSKLHSLLALALTVVISALVARSVTAQAATAVPTFQEANAVFASGNYRAAMAQYEAILAEKGFSAPVLFNLGNACYYNGQLGAAILNYERARILAPHDQTIAANLRLAQTAAGVRVPTINVFERSARLLSPNALAWTGSIALTTICLVLGVRRFIPRFTAGKVIIGVGVATLLAVTTSFAIRWPEFDRAIVVAVNAPARIAPASTAAASFSLKAGEPVSIAKSYGQFILACTPDGRSGWVSAKDVGRVFAPRDAVGRQPET